MTFFASILTSALRDLGRAVASFLDPLLQVACNLQPRELTLRAAGECAIEGLERLRRSEVDGALEVRASSGKH